MITETGDTIKVPKDLFERVLGNVDTVALPKKLTFQIRAGLAIDSRESSESFQKCQLVAQYFTCLSRQLVSV